MTEYLVEFYNNGYYIAEIIHRNSVSGDVKVVIPYNGTDQHFKKFYTIGRTYWTIFPCTYITSNRFIVTKETNPEYFI